MAAVELRVDLSALVNALLSSDEAQIIAIARDHLRQQEAADVLIGRIGMIAAHGDEDGHIVTTLAAAAMLSRYLRFVPDPLHPDAEMRSLASERALPLFARALLIAAPAVRRGYQASEQYPEPFFPSALVDTGKNVTEAMREAVLSGDAQLVERLMLGFYGTGADYRTLQVRTYDGIAPTFQHAGHPLIFAVRGFQLLDPVEWGDRVPHIIHWLAPHLPLHSATDEPEWVKIVRDFTSRPENSVADVRKRISMPQDEHALSLYRLILSNADTLQVCQGVYDALMKDNASPRAIGSVIERASAEVMQRVRHDDAEGFVQSGHGLLFAAAARQVFRQVQDVDVLTLLFTSAACINALHKEVTAQQGGFQIPPAPVPVRVAGGLMGPQQLEALEEQLAGQDMQGALTTARHYLSLKHDPRALFGVIGLAAARLKSGVDQGHRLQIVQAASEAFLSWPSTLSKENPEIFLQIALRAAIFGGRDSVVAQL
ncbi:MAG: hypothetical protein IMW89_02330 [Ktedonobacteraceae bacterium]|nr:hypothetical protein [Ktedonobacteraceae bacterium]